MYSGTWLNTVRVLPIGRRFCATLKNTVSETTESEKVSDWSAFSEKETLIFSSVRYLYACSDFPSTVTVVEESTVRYDPSE